MSVSLNQIVTSDTFGVWIERTNELVTAIGDVATLGGNSSDNKSAALWINGNITSTGNIVADVITPYDTSVDANIITLNSETRLEGDSFIDGVLKVGNNGSGNTDIVFVNGSTSSWIVNTNNSNLFRISTASGLKYLEINTTTNKITTAGLTLDTGILPSSATFVDGVTGTLTGDVKNEDGTIILQNGTNSVEATFNGTANNANYVSSLQDSSDSNQFDTDDIDEGTTNRFFTTTRARESFSNGTGVTITNGSVAIGQSVGTTDNVTFNSVTTSTLQRGTGSTATNIVFTDTQVQINPGNTNLAKFTSDAGHTFYGPLYIEDYSGNSAALDVKGAIRADSDITAFYNFSDIKLKENIDPIEGALAKVVALNGYTFNYKNKPDTRISGVIAQELIQVLPEAVYDIEDKETGETSLAVRYDGIVPLLIEAIKELKAEVEMLKSLANK